jgi:hypothetical protein
VGLVFVSGISAVCAASNDSSQVLTLHSDGIVPGWKMEMSPAALSRSIYFIVTGLIRAYAVTVDSDPVPEITCKLLALHTSVMGSTGSELPRCHGRATPGSGTDIPPCSMQ